MTSFQKPPVYKDQPYAVSRDDHFAPPPPAYDQVYANYGHASPSSPSSSASSSSSRGGAGRTIRFPERLVYNPAMVSTNSTLGPSKDEPRYLVQTRSKMINCFGLGDLVLRDGTDKLAPPIASVGNEKGSKKRRSLIRLAARDNANETALEVSMDGDYRSTKSFMMPLANGYPAKFEWRQSRSEEVTRLNGSRMPCNGGWKLVRVAAKPSQPGDPVSSEGDEVVAIGAKPRTFHRSPEFAFVGAGARGELGENFEIVAVMSFLRLYELYMQYMASHNTTTVVVTS
jgi:hypothetical protein